MYIRVTKEFRFEMAHALVGYDGPCKNIHGHSYRLLVTVKGIPVLDTTDPKEGMVVDFSDLKMLVNEEIIQRFDHALVLKKETAGLILPPIQSEKLILVDFQPTCENLTLYFAKKLLNVFPKGIELHHLLLWETSTAYSEWYMEDNQNISK
jgi:6-pyruvoyltetrahydropterin/6-carboxytetrahydropterin synthase